MHTRADDSTSTVDELNAGLNGKNRKNAASKSYN